MTLFPGSIFLYPRLSFTYSTIHQQVVSVYVGTGGTRVVEATEWPDRPSKRQRESPRTPRQ